MDDSNASVVLWMIAAVVAVWIATIVISRLVRDEIINPVARVLMQWKLLRLMRRYNRDPVTFVAWLRDWASKTPSTHYDPKDSDNEVLSKHLPNLREVTVKRWEKWAVSPIYYLLRFVPPLGVCAYFALSAPRELLGLTGGFLLFVAVMTCVYLGDALLPKFSSERK